MATKPRTKKGLTAEVKTTPTGAMAAHVAHAEGDIHEIGIWNLHVLLIPEGKFWVAQGLEIDYVTQGDSIPEAKTNFQHGLETTIDLNLRMYGNIDGLLVFAPDEVLKEAARKKNSIRLYSHETIHQLGAQSQQALPFDGISYLLAKESASPEAGA
jgi:hypothetical protein